MCIYDIKYSHYLTFNDIKHQQTSILNMDVNEGFQAIEIRTKAKAYWFGYDVLSSVSNAGHCFWIQFKYLDEFCNFFAICRNNFFHHWGFSYYYSHLWTLAQRFSSSLGTCPFSPYLLLFCHFEGNSPAIFSNSWHLTYLPLVVFVTNRHLTVSSYLRSSCSSLPICTLLRCCLLLVHFLFHSFSNPGHCHIIFPILGTCHCLPTTVH